jgi:hypothetical protein
MFVCGECGYRYYSRHTYTACPRLSMHGRLAEARRDREERAMSNDTTTTAPTLTIGGGKAARAGEPPIGVELWEGTDRVVTVGGAPCGQTLNTHDAEIVAAWLRGGLAEAVAAWQRAKA